MSNTEHECGIKTSWYSKAIHIMTSFLMHEAEEECIASKKVNDEPQVIQEYSDKFITHPYISPQYIEKISKFNSLIGHPYYGGEIANLKCQSQKHYSAFNSDGLENLPDVYAPCNGTVRIIREEPPRGTQIELQCDENPMYGVVIFHIRPLKPFTEGQHFNAGDPLGTHYTIDTYSDIALRKYGHEMTLHSVFEFMTDKCLAEYGLSQDTLKNVIISQEERDAFPSNCTDARSPLLPYAGGNADAPDDWYVI